MKTKRKIRFASFALAIMMLVLNFSTVAFAAENDAEQMMTENVVSVEQLDNGKTRTTYEFEIAPEDVDENGIATYAVDSSFTMTGTYYRGADRKYSGNYLDYTMIVTGSNGNPVDKQVSIQLWDYNHSYSLHTDIVNADGTAVTEYGVPIVANRTYYFKYYLVSGTTSNLRIRLIIDTWS